jgi:hypothetical protein
MDEDKLLLALQYLYNSINMLFFVPDDPKKKLPCSLRDIWGSYRANSFWRTYEDRQHKDEKCDLKKHITEAIHDNDLIDWQAVMRDRFIKESAKIVGVSVGELSATFSHLGLQSETVADPLGESDRQTEQKETAIVSYEILGAFMTTLILVNHSVANDGLTMDVDIFQVYEFFTLMPRGPPALSLRSKFNGFIFNKI